MDETAKAQLLAACLTALVVAVLLLLARYD